MSQQQSNSGFWLIAIIVVAVAMFLNALGGGGTSTTTTSTPSVDRSSFEHRYATERLKQEGYSNAEAQQAADAIIKFHNAQQNR